MVGNTEWKVERTSEALTCPEPSQLVPERELGPRLLTSPSAVCGHSMGGAFPQEGLQPWPQLHLRCNHTAICTLRLNCQSLEELQSFIRIIGIARRKATLDLFESEFLGGPLIHEFGTRKSHPEFLMNNRICEHCSRGFNF